MGKYIIHKAVGVSSVIKKNQRSLEEYGRTFDAYRKYDGCCVVLDGTDALSRTGEKYECLKGGVLNYLARNHELVFIGEAWWPGKDQFNLISGEFRRQKPSDRLEVKVHDVLTKAEFAAGHSPVPFRERIARGRFDGFASYMSWELAQGWLAGTYGCPQALCNALVDEGGYDGLILRDPNGTWTAGAGSTGEIVKIKRELSFDLRVLEVNTAPGKKTGRPVHTLVVDFNGKRLGVGSGVPHDLAEVPPVGSIVEVVAMDHSSDGLLREPRLKGQRFDKLAPDTF